MNLKKLGREQKRSSYMDKGTELTFRVSEIGIKYGQADKPTKIEVGKIMTGKRRVSRKKKRA